MVMIMCVIVTNAMVMAMMIMAMMIMPIVIMAVGVGRPVLMAMPAHGFKSQP
jgi:hypothetical protein